MIGTADELLEKFEQDPRSACTSSCLMKFALRIATRRSSSASPSISTPLAQQDHMHALSVDKAGAQRLHQTHLSSMAFVIERR